MATNTKFQDIRAQLETDITGRWTTDGLTADFSRYPVLGTVTREDRMVLMGVSFSQEPHTYGTYMESMEVEFAIVCPSFGNTVEEWDDAVGRAETLLDSALTILRTDITVNGTVFNVELGETENPVDQVDEHGPLGVITGVLEIESHV